jgi:hypothetical protein
MGRITRGQPEATARDPLTRTSDAPLLPGLYVLADLNDCTDDIMTTDLRGDFVYPGPHSPESAV